MTRTQQQNRALHLWLEWLAGKMREGGLDMRTVVTVPILPSKENIKADILHPWMRAQYPELVKDGKISTADLSTTQMQEMYEIFSQAFDERLNIQCPWPSLESLEMEARLRDGE